MSEADRTDKESVELANEILRDFGISFSEAETNFKTSVNFRKEFIDMTNKTSDKNVGSIEEDIRILQEKDCMWHYPETRIEEAIENIIADYTRQKEMNEEHQKINGELREKVKELEKSIEKISESSSNNEELIEKPNSGETFTVNQFDFIKKNFIPKQKIKEKIEELKNEKEQLRIDKNVTWDSQIYKLDLKIQVLQELLQEEDK